MKFVLMIAFTIAFSVRAAAQDTVFVYMGNEKAAQAIITPLEPEATLLIKKNYNKRAKSIIIQVYGEHIGGQIYRRDLEVAGDSTITVRETREGIFDISETSTKKQLLAGRSLKLYLLLNPANPNMMIPSKRVYLGNLVMK